MSEYQYYEFQAIDRPLSRKEMDQLRTCSSRARITATSFVNEYDWGDFRGDEEAWMERYFDAFLYIANWGTRVLKLRLSAELMPLADLRMFRAGEGLSARGKTGKVILTFSSDDEEGGGWVEGDGMLSELVPLRAELAQGDRRALYIGWLAGAQAGEISDEAEEPPVPAGLGNLSASLEALVDFLRLDADLLDVAAKASAPLSTAAPSRAELRASLTTIGVVEKDEMLERLLNGDASSVPAELRRRFAERQAPVSGEPGGRERRRLVAELREAAGERARQRKRIAAQKAKAAAERKARETAAARARHLDGLSGTESKLWGDIDGLVATKQPKSYAAAVALLVDLRDLAARKEVGDFTMRLEALRAAHTRKVTLLERLSKAGL